MTKVIAFMSQKGGVCKTTNALNLMGALDKGVPKGSNLYIDTDVQESTQTLSELRDENGFGDANFDIINLPSRELHHDIDKLRKSGVYRNIIIDCAGHLESKNVAMSIMGMSDFVFVPARMSKLDIAQGKPIAKIKTEVEEALGRRIYVYLLPSAVRHITGTAQRNLESIRQSCCLDVCPREISYNESIISASDLGLSIQELTWKMPGYNSERLRRGQMEFILLVNFIDLTIRQLWI